MLYEGRTYRSDLRDFHNLINIQISNVFPVMSSDKRNKLGLAGLKLAERLTFKVSTEPWKVTLAAKFEDFLPLETFFYEGKLSPTALKF